MITMQFLSKFTRLRNRERLKQRVFIFDDNGEHEIFYNYQLQMIEGNVLAGQDITETIANEVKQLNEITLTSSREYFIEVTTLSGQLLFSSYINKTEPLNAISIILIVVVSIVVVAGTVVFFLLRRRMKIK